MTKREERDAKRTFWLKHLQECASLKEHLSTYARRHELNVHEGYHWTRVLRREGLWPPQSQRRTSAASAIVASKGTPRFARVRVEPPRAVPAFPLRLQLVLANGRRAQLELSDERQLPRVLDLLEQPG
jgi:hypothetical protein